MSRRLLASVIIVSTILGLALLARGDALAQGEGRLRLQDLPPGSKVLSDATYLPTEISHPLTSNATPSSWSRLSGADRQALLAYKAAPGFQAVLPNGAFLGNFLYEYDTPTQAEAAATLLRRDLSSVANSTLDMDVPASPKGLRGQSFSLMGDQGDSVYWFVGTRGRTLVLLLVNGIDNPAVSSSFDAALQKLRSR